MANIAELNLNEDQVSSKNKVKKLLIVEDSQVIQNIIKHILGFYNYPVDTALDGAKALDMIKKNDYDAVLMDVAMPNMNGVDATAEIRKLENEKKANVPIIAVTGNAEFYTPTEFKKAGFTSFIEKPLDFDKMSKMLNVIFQNSN